MPSIEEQIEDLAKRELDKYRVEYYGKTQVLRNEIKEAVKKAPSKGGGSGNNFPDIQVLLKTPSMRHIPVMIEVKGTKGDLVKFNEANEVANVDETGKKLYNNIKKYAVNGAIHYAESIITYTESYDESIAIGINGYKEGNKVITEYGVYYLASKHLMVPKKIGDYTSLSFLSSGNLSELLERIDTLSLTQEEIDIRYKLWENKIEDNLKTLNQEMHDVHEINENYRVNLIAGLIMAGLGVENRVAPLQISELRGDQGTKTHDGYVISNKIESFLSERNLPQEKKDMIMRTLRSVFLDSNLHVAVNGESILKKVYANVAHNIMPYFNQRYHIDFTGKLFNTLNAWVKVADGNQNDVVLTPRYVCDMMVQLCKVNKDSYVWDYTTGSAGFLISAMKQMIRDAEEKLSSDPEKCRNKILQIKQEQLLGVEKLPDIYMLAVLNMILMGDGSSNIIHRNSLEYSGNYEQGKHINEPFPANVFLLNPPYSAEGKGMIFVEKALERMQNGRAAILIQENAGSGKGLPYTKNILEKCTLLASIKMADIFKGKANVQTAIYLFEIGTPHDPKGLVKFVDLSSDGYTRSNRRKASSNIKLRDTDHAAERYQEAIDFILDRVPTTNYLEGCFQKETISLEGKDWVYDMHRKFEFNPDITDFQNAIGTFLDWKSNKESVSIDESEIENQFQKLESDFKKAGGKFIKKQVSDFFDIKGNPQLDKSEHKFTVNGEYPYFTRTTNNNGILGYVEFKDNEHLIKGNSIAVGMMAMKFFYIKSDYYSGQFTKSLHPKFEGFDENIAQFFISIFNMYSEYLKAQLVRDFEKKLYAQSVRVPITTTGQLDLDYIRKFVTEIKRVHIETLRLKAEHEIEALKIAAGIK